MKRLMLLLFAVGVAGFALLNCLPSENTTAFPEEGTVRIVRDTYGVPHIYAANETEMMYGFGYALACDRARQIFTTVLTTHGRLAELWGEAALENDKMVRMFRLRALAEAGLDKLNPDTLKLIEAYCSGINAALVEHRADLPQWITRIEPVDVLAIAMMVNLDFALISRDSPFADLRRSGVGSNQFAVAPSRSAGGHALLSIDPHLMFKGMYRWTEAQLCNPDYSVVGAVLPGLPVVVLGHNGKVAWSMTVNFPDLSDVYVEKINPDDHGQYLAPDGWRDFSEWSETFRIKTSDGFREETQTFRASHHGPVIKTTDRAAYAARIAGLGEPGVVKQILDIPRATTVMEALDAFRTPGLNLQNIVVADTAGNIGYLYNALSPQRDSALDWSKAVPGADPRAEWGDYVPFEQLPRIINPAGGWLQNCNNSPWYVTENSGIAAGELPNRLCTVDILGDRGKRLRELLAADDNITFEEAMAYASDSHVLRARLWVPAMLEAAGRYPDLAGGTTGEALNLLRSWDLRCDADSAGMTLFFSWYSRGNLGRITDRSQITEDIVQKQLIELGAAAAELESTFGRLDVPWGEVQRLRHGENTYPVGGWTLALRNAWGRRNGPFLSVYGGSPDGRRDV